jgi:hypothetical protein
MQLKDLVGVVDYIYDSSKYTYQWHQTRDINLVLPITDGILDSKLKLNFMSFQVTTMNQCDVK